GDHTLTLRVARHEPLQGKECAVVETVRDGAVVAKEHLHVSAEGIYQVALDGKLRVPPLPLLKLPPKVGQRWEIVFNRQGKATRAEFHVGAEAVEVPAGKYEAVTLHGAFREGDARTLAFTYWFAAGVGPVKQVVRGGGTRTVMELERFAKAD